MIHSKGIPTGNGRFSGRLFCRVPDGGTEGARPGEKFKRWEGQGRVIDEARRGEAGRDDEGGEESEGKRWGLSSPPSFTRLRTFQSGSLPHRTAGRLRDDLTASIRC